MVSLNILSTRYQANHAVVIVHQMEKVMYIGYRATAGQSNLVADSTLTLRRKGWFSSHNFNEQKTSASSVNNRNYPTNDGVINKFNHGATIGA